MLREIAKMIITVLVYLGPAGFPNHEFYRAKVRQSLPISKWMRSASKCKKKEINPGPTSKPLFFQSIGLLSTICYVFSTQNRNLSRSDNPVQPTFLRRIYVE